MRALDKERREEAFPLRSIPHVRKIGLIARHANERFQEIRWSTGGLIFTRRRDFEVKPHA
jgi:hypothetical protein